MSVIIIVNVVISLTMILGGCCMRDQANTSEEKLIGFKTKRAMSDQAAWYYANQKCGLIWNINGTMGFLITIVSLFLMNSEKTLLHIQIAVLVLQTAAFVISLVFVEKKLKERFDRQQQ